MESPGWAETHTVVAAGSRRVFAGMVPGDRAFLLDFWTPGLQLARGRTADLRDVATAVAVFLNGARLAQLRAACPFVTYSRFSEAFERDEAEAITLTWEQLLDPPPKRARHMLGPYAFLVAASAEPRLHRLYPFTSHFDLGLRRSVPYGRGPALAWVRPFSDGRYLIAGPDRNQLYSESSGLTMWGVEPAPGALGPATAEQSAALVLTAMDRGAPEPSPPAEAAPSG